MILSEADVVALWSNSEPIAIPYFDNRLVTLGFEDQETAQKSTGCLNNFLALSLDDRSSDTRHVFAYYEDTCLSVGRDVIEEDMGTLPEKADDIWRYVHPTSVLYYGPGVPKYSDGSSGYIVIEGRCDWEYEHGILMSWSEGKTLVKVSQFDGHATNGNAFADQSRNAYVHYGGGEQFRTKQA